MTTTTHTITAELPIHMGGSEGENDTIKADVTFTYLPHPGMKHEPPEMEVIKVVPLNNESISKLLSAGELKDLGEDWLWDEGYDDCCDLAWNERHGDYE